jgi:hypothetical protein
MGAGFIVVPLLRGRLWQLVVDWKRLREKPRLSKQFHWFVSVMNRSGVSVIWEDRDGKSRNALAAGHDGAELQCEIHPAN